MVACDIQPKDGKLKFGFVPPQPKDQQGQLIRVDLTHLPPGMQLLAIKQMSHLPIYWIQAQG